VDLSIDEVIRILSTGRSSGLVTIIRAFRLGFLVLVDAMDHNGKKDDTGKNDKHDSPGTQT